jgi:hypothetical protein
MFTEAMFQRALAQPRLRQPVPEFAGGNRSEQVRVLQEHELQAMTEQWFVDLDRKVEFYATLGVDIAWIVEWAKKYWWSWLARDMTYNDELYTSDLRYRDPTTFGRTMVGLDEFVTYNFAYFDAIPDWRYDPLPDQTYIDIAPDGEIRIVIRYLGSGHWDGPLKVYPYDKDAPSIAGTGAFVQCAAIDRYHFNGAGLMYEGETLFDAFDATQSSGLLPGPESWQFKALLRAADLAVTARKARRSAPVLRSRQR